MRSIRIGKDIQVHWAILLNGKPVLLEGRDLKLECHTSNHTTIEIKFTKESNVAIFVIRGIDQSRTGKYSFTMWENFGKQGQTAVDYCDAFTLVHKTCEEKGTGQNDNLILEVVDLKTSDMQVSTGPPALSYTIRKSSTPATGYSDTYRLLEDGAVVGDPINIPTGYSDSDAEKVVSEHENSINSHKDIREYVEVINTELEKLHNYDDTAIREAIAVVQRQLDTLLNGDVNGVIDAFNEIETFLHGITELQTLTGLLADLRQDIVDQIPAYDAATPTAPGLMSAEDKKRLDSTPRALTKKSVFTNTLALTGGYAYYYNGTSSLTISKAGDFPDAAEYSTLTVPANANVLWALSEFKVQSNIGNITGSASSVKVYTIRRMPALDLSGYIYVVDCVLYI